MRLTILFKRLRSARSHWRQTPPDPIRPSDARSIPVDRRMSTASLLSDAQSQMSSGRKLSARVLSQAACLAASFIFFRKDCVTDQRKNEPYLAASYKTGRREIDRPDFTRTRRSLCARLPQTRRNIQVTAQQAIPTAAAPFR